MRLFALRIPLLALVSALTLGAVGCATEATHQQWDSLSSQEIEAGLTPSAPADLLDVAPTLQATQARLPALVETARFMGRFLSAMAEVAEADTSEAEEQLPPVVLPSEGDDVRTLGTSLFLSVACPGDQFAPVNDFSHGSARLDSPELTSLDVEALIAGGEFLLTFDACELGPITVDGRLPGRYLVDLDLLATAGAINAGDEPVAAVALDASQLDFQGSELPLGVVAFACGGSAPCRDDVRVSAELDAGDAGSFRVNFRVTSSTWTRQEAITVELGAVDGSSSCTFVYYTAEAAAAFGVARAPSLSCSSN